MRDLLRDAIDDPDLRSGMSVDMARRIEEVLADADATDLADRSAARSATLRRVEPL